MKVCSLCDIETTKYHYFIIYPENEQDIACPDCFELCVNRCEECNDFFNGDGSICPSCDYEEQ